MSAPKKISELPLITSLAPEDSIPALDDSAATPAAKNGRISLVALAAWLSNVLDFAEHSDIAEAVAGLLANPMTTAGDLIVGGGEGAPVRLPIGANDKLLGIVGGALAWVDPPEGGGSGGMTNPMEAAGDIIVGGAEGAPARLAIGANGKFLAVVDGALVWVDPPEGGGGEGMANPMTTAGDIIVAGEGGAPTRLAIGENNKILGVVGGALVWVDPPEGGGSGGTDLRVIERSYFGEDEVDLATVDVLQFRRASRVRRITAEAPSPGVEFRLRRDNVLVSGSPVVVATSAYQGAVGSLDLDEAFAIGQQLSISVTANEQPGSDSSTVYGPLMIAIYYEDAPAE